MTDWNNKEEVLEAVKEDGHALKQASEDLRADREVVLAVVKQSRYAIMYANDSLKNDPEFMKEVEQYL